LVSLLWSVYSGEEPLWNCLVIYDMFLYYGIAFTRYYFNLCTYMKSFIIVF
jgi:hypothetical protein